MAHYKANTHPGIHRVEQVPSELWFPPSSTKTTPVKSLAPDQQDGTEDEEVDDDGSNAAALEQKLSDAQTAYDALGSVEAQAKNLTSQIRTPARPWQVRSSVMP